MQPVVHFVVSMAVGALMVQGAKRRPLIAFFFGTLGVLPDLDHFMASGGVGHWMHSGYLLVIAPFMLSIGALVFDAAAPERRFRLIPFALAALAVLSGHLALDLASGGALPLAYPAETGVFQAHEAVLLATDGNVVVAVGDVVLGCWAILVCALYAGLARLPRWNGQGAPGAYPSLDGARDWESAASRPLVHTRRHATSRG
jgi:hypothetical protein